MTPKVKGRLEIKEAHRGISPALNWVCPSNQILAILPECIPCHPYSTPCFLIFVFFQFSSLKQPPVFHHVPSLVHMLPVPSRIPSSLWPKARNLPRSPMTCHSDSHTHTQPGTSRIQLFPQGKLPSKARQIRVLSDTNTMLRSPFLQVVQSPGRAGEGVVKPASPLFLVLSPPNWFWQDQGWPKSSHGQKWKHPINSG